MSDGPDRDESRVAGGKYVEPRDPEDPQVPKDRAEPSGYRGDNPASAGPGQTKVETNTPENTEGHLNPSAPGNAGTTPGTTGEK